MGQRGLAAVEQQQRRLERIARVYRLLQRLAAEREAAARLAEEAGRLREMPAPAHDEESPAAASNAPPEREGVTMGGMKRKGLPPCPRRFLRHTPPDRIAFFLNGPYLGCRLFGN